MITPRSCHCANRHKPRYHQPGPQYEPVQGRLEVSECHPASGQTSSDVGELEIQILIGLNGFLFH